MAGGTTGRLLTTRQRAFVAHYIVNMNGRQAAIAAGYGKKGADSQGSQLLKLPKVKALIDAALEKRAKKSELSAEWVLKEYARQYQEQGAAYRELEELNHVGLQRLYDEQGRLRPIDEWPDIIRNKQAVTQLEVNEIYEYDKNKGKRVLVGYTKKVGLADNKGQAIRIKQQELNVLRQIGEHVNIKAFDTKSSAAPAAATSIQVNVMFVAPGSEEKKSSGNGNGNGQAQILDLNPTKS